MENIQLNPGQDRRAAIYLRMYASFLQSEQQRRSYYNEYGVGTVGRVTGTYEPRVFSSHRGLLEFATQEQIQAVQQAVGTIDPVIQVPSVNNLPTVNSNINNLPEVPQVDPIQDGPVGPPPKEGNGAAGPPTPVPQGPPLDPEEAPGLGEILGSAVLGTIGAAAGRAIQEGIESGAFVNALPPAAPAPAPPAGPATTGGIPTYTQGVPAQSEPLQNNLGTRNRLLMKHAAPSSPPPTPANPNQRRITQLSNEATRIEAGLRREMRRTTNQATQHALSIAAGIHGRSTRVGRHTINAFPLEQLDPIMLYYLRNDIRRNPSILEGLPAVQRWLGRNRPLIEQHYRGQFMNRTQARWDRLAALAPLRAIELAEQLGGRNVTIPGPGGAQLTPDAARAAIRIARLTGSARGGIIYNLENPRKPSRFRLPSFRRD